MAALELIGKTEDLELLGRAFDAMLVFPEINGSTEEGTKFELLSGNTRGRPLERLVIEFASVLVECSYQ